jgi:multiple sugar transport system permease protein
VCIIVLCSWQALGYAVMIYLVGFKSLPTSLYEAAKLDGASAPQSFWYLSIPLLKPITLYVSVVTLVSGFNVYAQAFVLASDAQGAPGRQVRVLVLDMLENSFRNYRVGYAASEAVVLLAICLPSAFWRPLRFPAIFWASSATARSTYSSPLSSPRPLCRSRST